MIISERIKSKFSFNASTGYKINPIHHLIFWLIYFSFNTLRWGSYYNDYIYSLKGNILGFPIHMTLSYFTIYFLIPKFIHTRKYLLFTTLLILSIFTMVLLKFELTYLLISNNVWPEGPEETSSFTFNYCMVMMLGELYVISFVAAIKITIDWLSENKRASRLEKAQLETELKFLRSQISPHFFFNTLNNIYSLSLEKSNKTSETILKLSELMRYLIYETKENKQSLIKEIMCLQNYLELERIRYGDFLKINVNISGDIHGKKIAPMLLIPFLENAFKHGANKNIGKVEICIDLQVENNFLHFKINNTLPDKNIIQNTNLSGGIGIPNVRKRLDLVYAPEDYKLDILEEDEKFKVELKLKL